MITVGGFLANRSRRVSPPRMVTSSSLTILMTCCAGFSASLTSAPRARSLTARDELLDHGQRDVGLEQRDADLARGGVDVGLGELALAAEVLEGVGEAVGESGEHSGQSSVVGGRSIRSASAYPPRAVGAEPDYSSSMCGAAPRAQRVPPGPPAPRRARRPRLLHVEHVDGLRTQGRHVGRADREVERRQRPADAWITPGRSSARTSSTVAPVGRVGGARPPSARAGRPAAATAVDSGSSVPATIGLEALPQDASSRRAFVDVPDRDAEVTLGSRHAPRAPRCAAARASRRRPASRPIRSPETTVTREPSGPGSTVTATWRRSARDALGDVHWARGAPRAAASRSSVIRGAGDEVPDQGRPPGGPGLLGRGACVGLGEDREQRQLLLVVDPVGHRRRPSPGSSGSRVVAVSGSSRCQRTRAAIRSTSRSSNPIRVAIARGDRLARDAVLGELALADVVQQRRNHQHVGTSDAADQLGGLDAGLDQVPVDGEAVHHGRVRQQPHPLPLRDASSRARRSRRASPRRAAGRGPRRAAGPAGRVPRPARARAAAAEPHQPGGRRRSEHDVALGRHRGRAEQQQRVLLRARGAVQDDLLGRAATPSPIRSSWRTSFPHHTRRSALDGLDAAPGQPGEVRDPTAQPTGVALQRRSRRSTRGPGRQSVQSSGATRSVARPATSWSTSRTSSRAIRLRSRSACGTSTSQVATSALSTVASRSPPTDSLMSGIAAWASSPSSVAARRDQLAQVAEPVLRAWRRHGRQHRGARPGG